MKNHLLEKNLKVGTMVKHAEIPFNEYQVIAVSEHSLIIRDVNSRQDFPLTTENFLLNYRYYYSSKHAVEAK